MSDALQCVVPAACSRTRRQQGPLQLQLRPGARRTRTAGMRAQAAEIREALQARDAEVAAAQQGAEQRVRELQGAVEAARAQVCTAAPPDSPSHCATHLAAVTTWTA